MTIEVTYPLIMKAQVTSTITIAKGATLSDVQDQILECFWSDFLKIFASSIGKHGSKEDVILKDKDLVIDSDKVLQERLALSTSFQATFKEHALSKKQ
ncbi:MAG: hypothetical protein HYX48_08485 [Chlamydiales bacterium]|nr:hypothetical protein [Chlamydiales bacterium]